MSEQKSKSVEFEGELKPGKRMVINGVRYDVTSDKKLKCLTDGKTYTVTKPKKASLAKEKESK